MTTSLVIQLLGQSLGVVAIRVAGAGVSFLVSIFLARSAGPTIFGIYVVIVASATLLATAGALGWPGLVTRESAAALALRDWARLRGVVRFSILSACLAASLVMAVSGSLVYSGIVTYPPLKEANGLTLIVGGMLVPLLAASLVRAGILRGLRQVLRADLPDMVFRPATMLFLLVIVSVTQPGQPANSLETVLTCQLAATAVAFVIGFAFLKRALPPDGPAIRPARWMQTATPFWLIAQVGLLMHQVPLYLLGTLAPPEQLGLFAIAAQFAGIISLCSVAIEMPLQGRFAEAWALNDKYEAERVARNAGRIGLIVAVLCGGILIFFADRLLVVAGPAYAEAASPLRILVLGHIFYALSGPCRIALSMSGEERIVLIAVFSTLCATVVVALATIPIFGAIGAAVAGASSLVLLNVILQFCCWWRLGISTSPLVPSRR